MTAARDADIPIFAIDAATEPTDAYVLNVTTDQQGIVDRTLGALGVDRRSRGQELMVIGHDPHAGIRLRSGLAGGDRSSRWRRSPAARSSRSSPRRPAAPRPWRSSPTTSPRTRTDSTPSGSAGTTPHSAPSRPSPRPAGRKVTGVDAMSEAIAAIQAGGAFLATVEQPWPSILDIADRGHPRVPGERHAARSNFEAMDTTLVNATTRPTSPRPTSWLAHPIRRGGRHAPAPPDPPPSLPRQEANTCVWKAKSP